MTEAPALVKVANPETYITILNSFGSNGDTKSSKTIITNESKPGAEM